MIPGLDFVALDVETANAHRGSICAIGLAVVRDGTVNDTRSWLCRPPAGMCHFDPFNIHIHGIQPADVIDEPPFRERLDDALKLIGDRPIVAHNASFDIGAIRQAYDADERIWPTLRYGCTLVWSRRLLNLISYTLPMVAHSLHVEFTNHHEAGADAVAAAQIAVALVESHAVSSLRELRVVTRTILGSVSPHLWAGCRAGECQRLNSVLPETNLPANHGADASNSLFGQVVVFTGGLSTMVRSDARVQVARRGGQPAADVTKQTTRLVIGDGFAGTCPDQFRTGKAARASALLAQGQDIQVLTEQEFLAALTEVGPGGVRSD